VITDENARVMEAPWCDLCKMYGHLEAQHRLPQDATVDTERIEFIRQAALHIAERLLAEPSRFSMNESGALTESWRLAQALWAAKPKDC
jgi:hypothetical protein